MQHISITAQEIVQRYIDARGGSERIKGIRTLILHGPARPDGRPGREMRRARPYYFTIGEEGSDGAPWEAYDRYGLVARVTHAAGAALRHTAYFDDALIMSLEAGWQLELTGREAIAGGEASDEREALGPIRPYRLRVVYPDGWVNELFVDPQSWLLVARRFTAPFHAFGEAVTTQTLIGDYRQVDGVLFPMYLAEYEAATGELLGEGRWESVEANVDLPPATFAPPPVPDDPLARLVNAVFRARFIPADALGWYHDFQADPATAAIDTEGAIESVAYHCLKSGGIAAGTALLEENLRLYPRSAAAHFGLGRACRAAGREADARARFEEALRIDPAFELARAALASARLSY